MHADGAPPAHEVSRQEAGILPGRNSGTLCRAGMSDPVGIRGWYE